MGWPTDRMTLQGYHIAITTIDLCCTHVAFKWMSESLLREGGRGGGSGRETLTWSFCDGTEFRSVGFSHHSSLEVKCNENITCQRHIAKCLDKSLWSGAPLLISYLFWENDQRLQALATSPPQSQPLRPSYILYSNNLNDPLLCSFSYFPASSTPDPSPLSVHLHTPLFQVTSTTTETAKHTPFPLPDHTLIHTLRVNPIGPLRVSRSISPLDSPPQRVSSSCLWRWNTDTALFPFFIRSRKPYVLDRTKGNPQIISMFTAIEKTMGSSPTAGIISGFFAEPKWQWGVGAVYWGWHQGRPGVKESLNVSHLQGLHSSKALNCCKAKRPVHKEDAGHSVKLCI